MRHFSGGRACFLAQSRLIDIALWDLQGKLLGHSVAELLGVARPAVPILMALGYYREGEELTILREEYEGLVERGFRQFKMIWGGAASSERDLRRAREIFSVLPEDASLAVDVNGAWSQASQSHAFLDAIDGRLAFLEDPFTPDNEDALRELRSSSDTPIAIGEWESGRARFGYLIGERLVDVVRIDATAAGGISEWLAIADIAEVGTRCESCRTIFPSCTYTWPLRRPESKPSKWCHD